MPQPKPEEFGLTKEYQRYSERTAPFDLSDLFEDHIYFPTIAIVVVLVTIAAYVESHDLGRTVAAAIFTVLFGAIPAGFFSSLFLPFFELPTPTKSGAYPKAP